MSKNESVSKKIKSNTSKMVIDIPYEIFQIIVEYAYEWIEMFKFLTLSKVYNTVISELIGSAFKRIVDRLPLACFPVPIVYPCSKMDLATEYDKVYYFNTECCPQRFIPVLSECIPDDILTHKLCEGCKSLVGYDGVVKIRQASLVRTYKVLIMLGTRGIVERGSNSYIITPPPQWILEGVKFDIRDDTPTIKDMKRFYRVLKTELGRVFKITKNPSHVFSIENELVGIEKSLLDGEYHVWDGNMFVPRSGRRTQRAMYWGLERPMLRFRKWVIFLGGAELYKRLCIGVMKARYKNTLRSVKSGKIRKKWELSLLSKQNPGLYERYYRSSESETPQQRKSK